MARVAAIHNPLRHIDARACDVRAVIYIRNLIDWAAIDTHAELDLGTGMLSQLVALRLMGRMTELQAAARETAGAHLEVITTALRQRLPSWTWDQPRGGICLWVRLPAGDSTNFARLAAEYGVIVRAGATLSVDGSFTDRIRLAFGEDPDRLREAVDRLAAAWSAFEPGVRPGRAESTVSV